MKPASVSSFLNCQFSFVLYFFTFNSKRNLYGLKNTQILTRFEYPIWGTIRNLQFWGTRRPSSSFPVNGLSENNKNPLQEMKRKNYSPVSMRLQVKRVPSAVAFFRAFYGVTTVRAWHNICYKTATRLRSFDFRFQLHSVTRHKMARLAIVAFIAFYCVRCIIFEGKKE